LAGAKFTHLKRAKMRKLKQQLLLLENEIADPEDEADLARIRTRFYEHLDSDKGSKGSEEVPIIDNPVTKPVVLERVVRYSDPRVMEKPEPFIPEFCLKETQPPTIVPDPRPLEEVLRSILNPKAPPCHQPNTECGATSTVISADSASVPESIVAYVNLIATGATFSPPPPPPLR